MFKKKKPRKDRDIKASCKCLGCIKVKRQPGCFYYLKFDGNGLLHLWVRDNRTMQKNAN